MNNRTQRRRGGKGGTEMAVNCALSLRVGVRFSGICGTYGVLGGLTSWDTDCTLELSVEVADRLSPDDREQFIGPPNGPFEGASK